MHDFVAGYRGPGGERSRILFFDTRAFGFYFSVLRKAFHTFESDDSGISLRVTRYGWKVVVLAPVTEKVMTRYVAYLMYRGNNDDDVPTPSSQFAEYTSCAESSTMFLIIHVAEV